MELILFWFIFFLLLILLRLGIIYYLPLERVAYRMMKNEHWALVFSMLTLLSPSFMMCLCVCVWVGMKRIENELDFSILIKTTEILTCAKTNRTKPNKITWRIKRELKLLLPWNHLQEKNLPHKRCIQNISQLSWGYCNQLYFFVASLRNFGERTANLFSRKKKNTEQNAQDSVNQTEEAAVSLKNDLKNDANDIGENTGYYLCLSTSKLEEFVLYIFFSGFVHKKNTKQNRYSSLCRLCVMFR